MGETPMGRAFTRPERDLVPDDELAVLRELADRVRELTEATVLTAVDSAEAAAVSAEVAALTARLNARRREAPPFNTTGTGRMGRQIGNPVTGLINPIAPPVEVEVGDDGIARAEITLNDAYEGPPTFVHGGVSALILDQVLGMATAAAAGPAVTAGLELRYRRPTPLGVPLRIEGKASRVEGRRVYAGATISDPEGRVTVEATATFVLLGP
ncbi:PaaI family thioesterase [Spirillospora albida]|uniref:PaaI family thioesterase n=1 Tax=Spirillospora albida TaxID=58123 RepID=UPI0009FD6BBC|nr:PaaI family thioesterase [Spirillospora albida]